MSDPNSLHRPQSAIPYIAAPSATPELEALQDNTYLTRKQVGAYLRSIGYPISDNYLEKLSIPSRNQGPPVAQTFGFRVLYTKADVLEWARSRCASRQPKAA